MLRPFFALGCSGGGGSGTGGSSSNDFSAVLGLLESAAPDFDGSSMYLSSIGAQGPQFGSMANVSGAWTVANAFSPVDGGGLTDRLVDYMGDLMGETAQNSVFHRAKMPFLISCTIDSTAAKTGTAYTTGSQSMTLVVSSLSACGSASDYSGLDGQTVTGIFSNLTNTTNYDQKVVMTAASNPFFGGNEQTMYVRNNSTTLNFLHVEYDDATTPTQVSVTMISYNKTTGSGFFQYATKSGSGYNSLYRIYMDSGSDKARVFTYGNDGSRSMTTSVGALYSGQQEAAVSISWTGMTGSAVGNAGTDYNGCIDLTTNPPSVLQDGSLTCTASSTTVGAASTNTAGAGFTSAAIADLADIGITEATGAAFMPTFNDTTILSASVGF